MSFNIKHQERISKPVGSINMGGWELLRKSALKKKNLRIPSL